jgi:hypothetical protein
MGFVPFFKHRRKIMQLTNEEKAQYVAAIAAIWPNMPDNELDNITDDVADVMNKVLGEIKKCSEAFAVVAPIFSVIYGSFPPTSWPSILVAAALSGGSVSAWISALNGNMQFKACVMVAAANWKSVVQIALVGILK